MPPRARMSQNPPSYRHGPVTVDTASMHLYGSPATPDGAAQGGTSAGLVLLYAPGFAQLRPAYLLTAAEVVIGRDASAPISVPEQAVSRQHARIAYADGRWSIADLGSRNGTLVDGRFIREVELEHLHEVRIGDAIFKFVAKGAENYAPYRLDGLLMGGAARKASRMVELAGGYQIDR